MLAAALACATLLLVAGNASAFPIAISGSGPFTATSIGRVPLQGPITIDCEVTLDGATLPGPISSAGTAGAVTNGTARNCPTGSSATLNFGGTGWPLLPLVLRTDGAGNLTGISGKLTNVSFTVMVGLITCTYTGVVPILVDQPTVDPVTGLTINIVTVLDTDARHPRLTGDPGFPCGTGSIAAGTQFELRPAVDITRP